MQAASDIFLGWQRVQGADGVSRDYYIRQLRDWKGSFDVEGSIPAGLTKYSASLRRGAGTCPRPRSGDRSPSPATSARPDLRPRPSADFAEAYARQNQRDYEALKQAAASGRIQVESGL